MEVFLLPITLLTNNSDKAHRSTNWKIKNKNSILIIVDYIVT